MSGAELAARVTAARAVLGDYRREERAYLEDDAPPPAWLVWAIRLANQLATLLGVLGDTPGDTDAGKLAAIRGILDRVLGDELADRQYALERIEQIAGGAR